MITTIKEFASVSESLAYHAEKGIDVVANIFRHGSAAYLSCLRETRERVEDGSILLSGLDEALYLETDIGRYGAYRGASVPLDVPLEDEAALTEADYQGKDVELNTPNRGGAKKYHVYVKDPATGNVRKIAFGDVHGGLKARVSDPKARANFAARHQCHLKKDKTTAGYWACRVNRYAHLWNGNTYPGYW